MNDYQLGIAGDTYCEYMDYLERTAGMTGNFFMMAEKLRQYDRAVALLDEAAPWSERPEGNEVAATLDERVAAVLKVLKMRSIEEDSTNG